MNDHEIPQVPAVLDAIHRATERVGFTLASEPKTGSLLRALAASKPGGQFLELGTGTGVGTAWLLAGMDARSRLTSVDSDATVQEIARRYLGHDSRVRFHLGDGAAFLEQSGQQQFDLIYADAWPGKFTHLDLALALLKVGGMYFVDDLLPQPSWPEGHAPKVPALIADLETRPGFVATKLAWASGLMMLVRTDAARQPEMLRARILIVVSGFLLAVSLVLFGLLQFPDRWERLPFQWWIHLAVIGVAAFGFWELKRLRKVAPVSSLRFFRGFPLWLIPLGLLVLALVAPMWSPSAFDMGRMANGERIYKKNWFEDNGKYFVRLNSRYVREVSRQEYFGLERDAHQAFARGWILFSYLSLALWHYLWRRRRALENTG